MTTAPSTMSRKRPASGTAASLLPTMNNANPSNMPNTPNFYNSHGMHQSNGNSSTQANGAPIQNMPQGVNLFPAQYNLNGSVGTPDLYNYANVSTPNDGRMSAKPTPGPGQALSMQMENNQQVARITNRNSSLMRLPAHAYYQSGLTPAPESQQTQLPIGSPAMGATTGNFDIYGELAPLIRKAKQKKANIPPFVQKLSQFVNDPKCDHLIRWSPAGTSFLVLDEDEFSKTLIPDLFKHNNYASFVRQLNMYGFHKVVGLADGSLKTSEQRSKPPSEYKNQYFIRGMPDLMWLIQKPKNTTKRNKGRKKGKVEDSDDEAGSDGETPVNKFEQDDNHGPSVTGGGFIETIPSQQLTSTTKPEINALMTQIEQVKQHQTVISNAINRLRKDHAQLYEQSLAFQNMHEQHQNSIGAILSFLASVYDKSIGGQISAQMLAQLFQGAVDATQNASSVVTNHSPNSVAMGRNGAVGTNGVQTRPFKRRPLMLPPAPIASASSSSASANGLKGDGNSQSNQQQEQQQQQTSTTQSPFNLGGYQSPSIQEVYTPSTGPLSPGITPLSPSNQMNGSFFGTPFFPGPGTPAPQDNHIHNSPSPQPASALTPRLRGALSPLLQVPEPLVTHHNKVAETTAMIDNVQSMQDAQTENINRLMEIVGSVDYPSSSPSSSTSSSRVVPVSSASSSTSTVTSRSAARCIPLTAPAAAVAHAGVVSTAPASPVSVDSPKAAPANLAPVRNQNGSPLMRNQTSPATTTATATPNPTVTAASAPSPFDNMSALAGFETDMGIEQFLTPGFYGNAGGADAGVDGAMGQDEYGLGPMFLTDTNYDGYGMLQGDLGNMGMDDMGLDGATQIVTGPSTAVGSPELAYDTLDGEQGGSAKKKRRTG